MEFSDLEFKKKTPSFFPGTRLSSINLYDIFKVFGNVDGFDYESTEGDRVIVRGGFTEGALKNTTIYLGGGGNELVFDGLTKVSKLEVAAVKNSKVFIQAPMLIRGMTIMSSQNSHVSMGKNCLISTDVLVYSSNAHALYNVADGKRRLKEGVEIGERVWVGMGARLMSGARVGKNSVIGGYSILAGKIPNNCAAAGNPCRVTTRDVFWTSVGHQDRRDYLSRTGKNKFPIFAVPTEEDLP